MTGFFAKPNLDNLQFKQLASSVLTLSGQTKIATTSGLTLTNGIGGYVKIIATGGTDNKVLTYLGGNIVLRPTTGGGNMVYTGASPTTCTVGGLVSSTPIYNQSISHILEQILVPTVCPTVTGPANTVFALSPSTPIYEVGTCVTNICAITCFSRGCVSPVYSGGTQAQYRSGTPVRYNYVQFSGVTASISSSALCNCHGFPAAKIQNGNNILSASVTYSSGCPVYDSTCNVWLPALPSGTTSPSLSCTVCGLYPYYWGKVASGGSPAGVNRPTINKYLVTGGTKVVNNSSSTICVNFNSTSDDYIWFATPNESTTKTKWYVDALNNGNIGGVTSVGGNLFPDHVAIADVASSVWSGVGASPHSYKVYVSNYQTSMSTIIELKNS